jgi:hypothetical protein
MPAKSANVLGQPCVMSSAVAAGSGERTWAEVDQLAVDHRRVLRDGVEAALLMQNDFTRPRLSPS